MPSLVEVVESPVAKRAASNLSDARPHKRSRTSSSNPLQLKPLGHLFLHPNDGRTRSEGLGNLARLPDELLLSHVFSDLDAQDLLTCAGVSKAFFAWSRIEGVWKNLYISETNGRLLEWHGSWRSSFVATFRTRSSTNLRSLPTDSISTPRMSSDVLFQPALCASFDANSLYGPSFKGNIPRRNGVGWRPRDLPDEPVILTGLMDTWPAMQDGSRRWTLPALARRFPETPFRAEATLTRLPDYQTYHNRCDQDESPLYLFESDFVEKTRNVPGTCSLGDDYKVPECFTDDLFEVMGSIRPNYRWLIVGPKRSGSTWHQDPNGTSAWNAVLTGRKAWVMFPNSVLPPGVRVSDDMGHVECPLSLAEWFMSYYKAAKDMYGKDAKGASRGVMREGICEAGEVVFVPSGWWHIVVNLEPSIAVTQNFVSSRELANVLRFMRDRPSQVSGFKRPCNGATGAGGDAAAVAVSGGLDEADEALPGVYDMFVRALREQGRGNVEDALKQLEAQDAAKEEATKSMAPQVVLKERGLWDKVRQDKEEVEKGQGEAFNFGFDFGEAASNEEYAENDSS